MRVKTYNEQLQKIVEDYRNSGNPWPAERRSIAKWAINKKKWQAKDTDIIDICAREISQAMRTDFFVDVQGRKVRKKYPVRKKVKDEWGVPRQIHLWADIEDASREFMEMHFQQRRQQRAGEIIQMKTDLDSYNENKNPGPPIQLSWDFTEDIAEHKAPDTHPDFDSDDEDELL